MVLTRAQRAQTKATPPESPLKSSVLKAPVRRGRAKQIEAAEPKEAKEATATKAVRTTKTVAAQSKSITKDVETKASLSRSASARTATTKASAARAAAAATVKAAPAKTTNARTAASKAVVAKAAPPKAATTRKTSAATKTTRGMKTAKQPQTDNKEQDETSTHLELPLETVHEETSSDSNEVGEESVETEEALKTAAPPTTIVVKMPSQMQEPAAPLNPSKLPLQEPAAPSSPSKLPQPAPSPFKMSLLSSVQGLGSVRKPANTGALLASPAKPVLQSNSPVKSTMVSEPPVRLNTSIRDFAAVLGSPRRPGSSGSDNCSSHSREGTPKRPHADEIVTQQSTKRLRTSMSMPSLGSPRKLQSTTSDSPPSPSKSSLRSPEKRPGLSPKKVSWHQTPPPPVALRQMTPQTKQPGILDDCVFFLDVNSLTGVNQNCLFAGLIDELGGSCIQEWSHNNMGITHVLFMNGEMRTLEKVLASNGEVFCVSLGWLLDCQREGLRIPENQPRYLIDLTHVPGATPKPNRSALNTPMTSRTAPVSHTPAVPPPQWALPTTPAVSREPLGTLPSTIMIKTPSMFALKATPAPPPSVGMGTIDEHDKENVSPVSENTPLLQKTCPPQQFNKSIMAMSTGISATPLRSKFLASKRRRSFDGVQKTSVAGMQSPPRKPFGLGSPRRQASPQKRAQLKM